MRINVELVDLCSSRCSYVENFSYGSICDHRMSSIDLATLCPVGWLDGLLSCVG